MVMLNSAFKLYLESFPSILLGIAGFYFFATVRYWHDIPLLTYMNFPACGLRCFYESMTPLRIAGQVNEESAEVLAEWKKLTDTSDQTNDIIQCQASCQIMRCTAGSMYTFENSIVVTTIHNTCILTCNLLIIYK